MGGLVFRAAHAADAERTVALWRRCGLTTPQNSPEEDFSRAVISPASAVILAYDGEQLVGSAMVGDDGHRAVVYYVCVSPEKRGTGLGSKLMVEAETWARQRGARKLNLMVREENAEVRAFYESIGYNETPRLVMAKWLDT